MDLQMQGHIMDKIQVCNPQMLAFLMNNSGFGHSRIPPPPMGVPPGQSGGDPSEVRDDRGNPATKNLFVAGYGQGTTEHSLRELFSAHTQIVGIISKGTFSFINTTDKLAAIRARE